LPLHQLLELRSDEYEVGWDRVVDRWLSGLSESWWVAISGGALRGAVRAARRSAFSPDRLEVLVRAEDVEWLGSGLAARGLASLRHRRGKVVESVVPVGQEKLAAVLEVLGFRRSQELVQMKLDLRSTATIRQPYPAA
jgi:hypothetical protein